MNSTPVIASAVALIVLAEVHSDDHAFEVDFDATSFFAQASDDDIRALHDCDWGGDYPADAVAEFFQGKNDEIDSMFEHIHSIRNLHSHKDMCGFECHVDPESALAWLAVNRPHLKLS